ncbi:MAG: calcineurin-like phosphoesterase C-terminal domain-containing protein [Paludibacter sp.]
MKNKFLYLHIALMISANLLFASTNNQPIRIQGKVLCNGNGVSSVSVTDGISVVETDNNGRYVLSTCSARDFVYYSLPSGYDSPIMNGVPVFYDSINKSKKEQTVNFTLTKCTKSQLKHAFILWADPQVQENKEFDLLQTVVDDVKKTVSSLSSQIPVHAISCGDNVFDQLGFYDKYKQMISQTGLPFYQVVGNHDMDYNNRSDEFSSKTFSSKFGPEYYSFNKGRVHYIVLKDVFYYGYSYRYIGYVNENQLSWLEKDLSRVKPGSTVIVSLHIPTIYGESSNTDNFSNLMSNSVMNRAALYKILAPFNAHILAGHSHTQWTTVVSPTLFEHTHVAACAAWWQGEIGVDGTPKGYTVYTVDGDSLSWYFKGVNLSKDDQFKLYPINSDLINPGCIIANVYNYDSSWKVEWYENDSLIGNMQQYWGEDPLAKELYIPGKNKKYSWLGVEETHHLFKAKVLNINSKITIKVTDRFGNIYIKGIN